MHTNEIKDVLHYIMCNVEDAEVSVNKNEHGGGIGYVVGISLAKAEVNLQFTEESRDENN